MHWRTDQAEQTSKKQMEAVRNLRIRSVQAMRARWLTRMLIGLGIFLSVAATTSSARRISPTIWRAEARLSTPSLLDRAQKLAGLQSTFPEASYRWISNHVLVVTYPTDPPHLFWQYDMLTGELMRITSLDETPVGVSYPSFPDASGLSPDGRFIIWRSGWPERPSKSLGCQDMTGALSGGGDNLVSYCWLADSRHWIGFEQPQHVTKRTRLKAWLFNAYRPSDRPEPMQVILPGFVFFPPWPTFFPTSDRNIAAFPGENLISTSDRRLIVDDWNYWSSKNITRLTVRVMRLTKQISLIHRYTIRTPIGRTIHTRSVSPLGDKIAWCLLDPSLLDQAEIWTSRLDGTQWRKIGSLPPGPNFARNIQWTQDSKQISFIYKNEFYVVPVDGGVSL